VATRLRTEEEGAGAVAARPAVSADAGTLSCIPWRTMDNAAGIAAWDALAAQATEPNPFHESWYLLPSLRHLRDTASVSLLRFEIGGRLAGLLPIARPRRYYRWPVPHLGNWLHPNMFCGAPLVAPDAEVPFWRALLHWADRHAGAALFLHLRDLPLAGPLHAALDAVLAVEGQPAEVVHREERAMLASDLSPNAYLEAAMSGKKRKELRRQANRLADEGTVAFERRTDGTGLDTWCTAFLALEQAGWKGKAGSALACSAQNSALVRDALAGAAGRGRLERLSLTLDGRPIAMLATFLTPPGAFSFKTAFDERYARFSPGVLLQRENLAILDRPEIGWSDSCAAADHPMIDHVWRERRTIGRLSIGIGGVGRRALFRRFVRAETARTPAQDP